MPAEIHRIVRTGKGMGGFLAPPGHPDHSYEVRSYYARPGKNDINIGRRREADGYSALGSVIENDRELFPESTVAAARRIMDRAELTCSEAWVRSVYGYFRSMYSPDGTDRNASNAVSASDYRCACGEHSYNRRIMQLHLNQVLKAMLGLRKKYSRKPETAEPGPHHLVKPDFPPEHHLGYLHVRSYFPEHTPRLDLIADPGSGYGSHSCIKCGKTVQYDASKDAQAEVLTRGGLWAGTDANCPRGGQHEIEN